MWLISPILAYVACRQGAGFTDAEFDDGGAFAPVVDRRDCPDREWADGMPKRCGEYDEAYVLVMMQDGPALEPQCECMYLNDDPVGNTSLRDVLDAEDWFFYPAEDVWACATGYVLHVRAVEITDPTTMDHTIYFQSQKYFYDRDGQFVSHFESVWADALDGSFPLEEIDSSAGTCCQGFVTPRTWYHPAPAAFDCTDAVAVHPEDFPPGADLPILESTP